MTTIGFGISLCFCTMPWIIRAIWSAPPQVPAGMMNSTGLVGCQAASAPAANTTEPNPASIKAEIETAVVLDLFDIVVVSLLWFAVVCRFLLWVKFYAALIGGRADQKCTDVGRVFLMWYATVMPTS